MSFPVDKFYVDVEWAKLEEEYDGDPEMPNMFDLVNVGKMTAANILLEGKRTILQLDSCSTEMD